MANDSPASLPESERELTQEPGRALRNSLMGLINRSLAASGDGVDQQDSHNRRRGFFGDRTLTLSTLSKTGSDLGHSCPVEPQFPQMTYTDLNVQDACDLVLQGLQLELVDRRRSCWAPCGRVKSTALNLWNADPEWHAMVHLDDARQTIEKIYLADMEKVNPCISRDSHAVTDRAKEFTIVTKSRGPRTFRAANRDSMKLWVTALQHQVWSRRQNVSTGQRLMDAARFQFQLSDINHDRMLGLEEVAQLFRRLNMDKSRKDLQVIFSKYDKDDSGLIEEDEFTALFCDHMVKQSLKPYFDKYSVFDDEGCRVMSRQTLRNFYREVQGQGEANFKLHHVWNDIADLGCPLTNQAERTPHGLTELGFSTLISHSWNAIYDTRFSRLHQDMTRPLSYYWISCSHNTYLEDAQIGGTASVEQYIEVIRQGCRCVEIDCWDGYDGTPVVTHGYTLTSKISFEEVVVALRHRGFETSPFPLILSLEMHCSPEQCASIGFILRETFGDRLLMHPAGGFVGQPLVSPEEAMGKVIVKAKLVNPGHLSSLSTFGLADREEDNDGSDEESPTRNASTRTMEESPSRNASGRSMEPTGSISSESGCAMQQASTLPETHATPKMPATSLARRRLHRQRRHALRTGVFNRRFLYGLLGQRLSKSCVQQGLALFNQCVYLVSRKLRPMALERDRQPCNISSLSAPQARKMAAKHGRQLNAYHSSNLTRVYPPGHSIRSGNFSPVPHWIHGTQLVALNYQHTDLGSMLNEGMFREQNGGIGYVLKPPMALRGQEELDWHNGKKFGFRALSAHHLPRPSAGGYRVVIDVHGLERDTRSSSPQKVGEGRPSENETEADNVFVTTVACPEVAILVFRVYGNRYRERSPTQALPARGGDSALLAAAAFPTSGIRDGVRWIPLRDLRKQPLENCGLLIEVRSRPLRVEAGRRPGEGRQPTRQGSKGGEGTPGTDDGAASSRDDGKEGDDCRATCACRDSAWWPGSCGSLPGGQAPGPLVSPVRVLRPKGGGGSSSSLVGSDLDLGQASSSQASSSQERRLRRNIWREPSQGPRLPEGPGPQGASVSLAEATQRRREQRELQVLPMECIAEDPLVADCACKAWCSPRPLNSQSASGRASSTEPLLSPLGACSLAQDGTWARL